MTAQTCDPRALSIAQAIHQRENPQATILFGSRARGDYEENRSDVDILLVLPEKPGTQRKEDALEWAEELAQTTYRRRTPVQLVWLSREEFDERKRYVNDLPTQALLDGVIMSQNPEDFQSRYSRDDEETEYEYQWTDYHNRLYHAESHLAGFHTFIDAGHNDLLIGQQAQSTLEHAMKAVICGHGGTPGATHNIGRLLGSVRRIDPELRDFRLSIPADVYTAYAGEHEYDRAREQPTLTKHDNYRERTAADAQRLIERARQLGPNLYG